MNYAKIKMIINLLKILIDQGKIVKKRNKDQTVILTKVFKSNLRIKYKIRR